MKLTKILSIAVAAFASLTTVTFPLAAATLIACGEDNTAGTDEQPNAITAQINAAIDSAFADWSKSSTLIKVTQEPCEVCPDPSSYIIYDPSNTTLPPGVQTERGVLYRISLESFESFTCQTEETWFTYSVSTIDSLVRKNFVVPDSVSADEFKADCALENGEICAYYDAIQTDEDDRRMIKYCNSLWFIISDKKYILWETESLFIALGFMIRAYFLMFFVKLSQLINPVKAFDTRNVNWDMYLIHGGLKAAEFFGCEIDEVEERRIGL